MREAGLNKQLSYLNEKLSNIREAGLREELSGLNEELSTM